MKNTTYLGEALETMGTGSLTLAYQYVSPDGTETIYELMENIYAVGSAENPINKDKASVTITNLTSPIPREASEISFILVYVGKLGYEERAVVAKVLPLTSEIAYVYKPGGGTDPIYIYTARPDGTCPTRVAGPYGPYLWYRYPAWSRDGTQLAFSAVKGDNSYDIIVVDLTSDQPYPGNIRAILDSGKHELSPSFNSDGTKIVAQRIATSSDSGLILFDVATGGWEFIGGSEFWLDKPGISSPKWSPQGEQILYSLSRWIGGSSLPPTDIMLIDPGGSPNISLTQSDTCRNLQGNWSPDGQKIIFVSNRDGGANLDLWIMDITGENKSKIYDCPVSCQMPSFSPDGERIVFTFASNPAQVYTIGLDGSGLSRLIDTDSPVLEAEWSPYLYRGGSSCDNSTLNP